MDDKNRIKQEPVYSAKVKAGKRRTYFFDVRKSKFDDYYLVLTESAKKFNSEEYERHKIYLYKEDFNRFLDELQKTIDHVKKELMPDFDYEQFDRRDQAYEDQDREQSADKDDISW